MGALPTGFANFFVLEDMKVLKVASHRTHTRASICVSHSAHLGHLEIHMIKIGPILIAGSSSEDVWRKRPRLKEEPATRLQATEVPAVAKKYVTFDVSTIMPHHPPTNTHLGVVWVRLLA